MMLALVCLTVDPASLSRRSTVPTHDGDTSNVLGAQYVSSMYYIITIIITIIFIIIILIIIIIIIFFIFIFFSKTEI